MSRYTGPQGKGAARRAKEQKRLEAEVRNEAHVAAKAAEQEETEDAG